jgi:hypothetical protein
MMEAMVGAGDGVSRFSIPFSQSSSSGRSPSRGGSPSFSLFRGSANYVGDSNGQEFAQTVEDMLREEDKNCSRARGFRSFGYHYF